jgi:pimeloyl-ACP methyl ester carboxylesterase
LDPDQDWQGMRAGLLRLSSESRHVIADQSGHNVQLDQPAAAVGAIVQLVEQLRR